MCGNRLHRRLSHMCLVLLCTRCAFVHFGERTECSGEYVRLPAKQAATSVIRRKDEQPQQPNALLSYFAHLVVHTPLLHGAWLWSRKPFRKSQRFIFACTLRRGLALRAIERAYLWASVFMCVSECEYVSMCVCFHNKPPRRPVAAPRAAMPRHTTQLW